MKNILKLLILTALGGCAVHMHVDVDTGDSDRDAIQKVRLQFEKAMQTGNPDAAVAVFDDDAVVMSPDHVAYEGIDAARQWAVKNLTQTHSGMSFKLTSWSWRETGRLNGVRTGKVPANVSGSIAGKTTVAGVSGT